MLTSYCLSLHEKRLAFKHRWSKCRNMRLNRKQVSVTNLEWTWRTLKKPARIRQSHKEASFGWIYLLSTPFKMLHQEYVYMNTNVFPVAFFSVSCPDNDLFVSGFAQMCNETNEIISVDCSTICLQLVIDKQMKFTYVRSAMFSACPYLERSRTELSRLWEIPSPKGNCRRCRSSPQHKPIIKVSSQRKI